MLEISSAGKINHAPSRFQGIKREFSAWFLVPKGVRRCFIVVKNITEQVSIGLCIFRTFTIPIPISCNTTVLSQSLLSRSSTTNHLAFFSHLIQYPVRNAEGFQSSGHAAICTALSSAICSQVVGIALGSPLKLIHI